MTKPIFIVRYPNFSSDDDVYNAQKILDNNLKDYHTIIIKDVNLNTDIKFECYNSPHTEIEFNEFKQKILALIK
jgi:hypothetical protein